MDCGLFWSRCARTAQAHPQPEILVPPATAQRLLRPLGRRSSFGESFAAQEKLCDVVGRELSSPATPPHVMPRLRHMNSSTQIEHLKPSICNPVTPPSESSTHRRRRARSERSSMVSSTQGIVSSWRIPPTAVMTSIVADRRTSINMEEPASRLLKYNHGDHETFEMSRLPGIPSVPLRKPGSLAQPEERNHLKSALKKEDAGDTLKPSQVVLTGPVALRNDDGTGAVSPSSRLPKSFWDDKDNEDESEGGDAMFIGPGERGRSSVLLVNKPEPPVRPPARENENSYAHHYTPTRMTTIGGPPISSKVESFSTPTVNLTKQHAFSVSRRRSSIKEEVEKLDIDQLERATTIDASPFYRTHLAGSAEDLTGIIRVAGDQMCADGAELQYVPSTPTETALVSYRIHIDKDCEKIVLRKASETAGIVLPIRDIINTYTWIEVLKSPQLHCRLSDSIFETLSQEQLRSMLVIQYRQGMFIKCDWFVAECPNHALSIHMLCSAAYSVGADTQS